MALPRGHASWGIDSPAHVVNQELQGFLTALESVLAASSTTKGGTYFLAIIAKEEEISYSVSSSVTSCLELLATSFAEIISKNT